MPRHSNACLWNDCDIIFNSVDDLFEHLSDMHVGRKSTNNLSLKCYWSQCEATAAKRDHLISHLRVHLPLKSHPCNICTKSFKRPQDLKKHERIHTLEHKSSLRSKQPGYKAVRRRHPLSTMAMVREGTTGTLTALGMPDTTKTSEDTLLSFYESYTNGLETVSAQNSREERQSENWVGTSGAVPPPIAASHISHSDAAQSQTVHDHNPLQSLLENVLYDETFTPSYDLGMKHRLESLSQLVKQQESAWSLPTTKPEDINTLQPWLEQLSSNIQTGSCLYPDILSPHVDEQGVEEAPVSYTAHSTSDIDGFLYPSPSPMPSEKDTEMTWHTPQPIMATSPSSYVSHVNPSVSSYVDQLSKEVHLTPTSTLATAPPPTAATPTATSLSTHTYSELSYLSPVEDGLTVSSQFWRPQQLKSSHHSNSLASMTSVGSSHPLPLPSHLSDPIGSVLSDPIDFNVSLGTQSPQRPSQKVFETSKQERDQYLPKRTSYQNKKDILHALNVFAAYQDTHPSSLLKTQQELVGEDTRTQGSLLHEKQNSHAWTPSLTLPQSFLLDIPYELEKEEEKEDAALQTNSSPYADLVDMLKHMHCGHSDDEEQEEERKEEEQEEQEEEEEQVTVKSDDLVRLRHAHVVDQLWEAVTRSRFTLKEKLHNASHCQAPVFT